MWKSHVLTALLLVGTVEYLKRSDRFVSADTPYRIISVAEQYLGSPYRFGGSSPKGFDCSGFVNYVYNQCGLQVPRSSHDMLVSEALMGVEEAMPGDIILFKGRNRQSSRAGHSGIVTRTSENQVWFIHSATHSGVREDSLTKRYYHDRVLGVVRYFEIR